MVVIPCQKAVEYHQLDLDGASVKSIYTFCQNTETFCWYQFGYLHYNIYNKYDLGPLGL